MKELIKMAKEQDKKYILALETSFNGGSVSILKEIDEVDSVLGVQDKSRSVTVLDDINELLIKNKIKKQQLKLIAVSSGPGSLTGVRVGMALAKGLSDALKIPCRAVSVLQALALESESDEMMVLTAVCLSRDEISYRAFFKHTKEQHILPLGGAPEICSIYEFEKKILQNFGEENFDLVLTDELYRKFNDSNWLNSKKLEARTKVARKNLAVLIGREVSLGLKNEV